MAAATDRPTEPLVSILNALHRESGSMAATVGYKGASTYLVMWLLTAMDQWGIVGVQLRGDSGPATKFICDEVNAKRKQKTLVRDRASALLPLQHGGHRARQ